MRRGARCSNAKGTQYFEVHRWRFQGGRLKELVEIYTSMGLEVEEGWRILYFACKPEISPGSPCCALLRDLARKIKRSFSPQRGIVRAGLQKSLSVAPGRSEENLGSHEDHGVGEPTTAQD